MSKLVVEHVEDEQVEEVFESDHQKSQKDQVGKQKVGIGIIDADHRAAENDRVSHDRNNQQIDGH